MKIRLEILKCMDCGRLVFATGSREPDSGGTRLSKHKCSGSWQTVLSEQFEFSELENEAYE